MHLYPLYELTCPNYLSFISFYLILEETEVDSTYNRKFGQFMNFINRLESIVTTSKINESILDSILNFSQQMRVLNIHSDNLNYRKLMTITLGTMSKFGFIPYGTNTIETIINLEVD
ncbi:hypothetical protein BpHYR1_045571 [Brachionus plicatilis]|uniref:Uncharacterized protein n=1 Tax=Brachionus plicatilis TaxID=10195 RepID=A0A3M7QMA4_BRAPC|nr:hypothetical protein BpHYR1_045571 [Brachionus plicatilis]